MANNMVNDGPTNDHLKDVVQKSLSDLDDLLQQTVIAQGTKLARNGNLAAAEEILQPLIEKHPSHAVYDLLARIKAQQGDIEAADKLWQIALQYKPACPECLAGLAKIQSLQNLRNSPARGGSYLKGFLWLAGFCLLIFLIFQIKTLNQSVNNLASLQSASNALLTTPAVVEVPEEFKLQQQAILSKIDVNQVEIQRLSDNLSLLTTSTSTQIAPAQSILDQININVPGVTPIYQQQSLTLLFEDGLFLYTWGLKENALTTLQNVGLQLQPYQDKINISVIGFTDQLERNHLDFPFMRANAVIRYLVDNTQLPEQIFTILPAGNRPPPFPNDSTENRFQNRTVIMIIKPAE